MSMKIEHIALNVTDPVEVAKWYVENLGMRIVRSFDKPPYIHFIADEAGQGVIEIYHRQEAPVPDYAAMHPLVLHIAFAVEDVDETRAKLIAAGATAEGEVTRPENGDLLAFVRDPWGIPLQLANRRQPLV